MVILCILHLASRISLIVAFIAFFSISCYSQECEVELSYDDCAYTEWVERELTVPLNVPGFPPCPIKYIYEYRRCGCSYEVRSSYFQWYNPDDCPALAAYLLQLSNSTVPQDRSTFWGIVNNAFAEFPKLALTDLAENIIFIQCAEGNQCIEPAPSCVSPWNVAQASAIWSRCTEYISTAPSSPFSPNSDYRVYVRRCRNDFCCVLKRKICYIGITPRVCESWYQIGTGTMECSGQSNFTPPWGSTIQCRSGCMEIGCTATQ